MSVPNVKLDPPAMCENCEHSNLKNHKRNEMKILVEFMTGQQYTESNWRPCRNAKVFKETGTVKDILDFLSKDKGLKSADLVILEE